MSTSTEQQGRRGGLEVRSIDYVPLSERHGKLWHLGPLWFMSNAQIATLAVGVVSVSAGGNLVWCLLAIVARRGDRHLLHGRAQRAGPAARAAADDPVAAAVRVRRRDPGVAVRLPAVRRLQHLQHPAGRRLDERHGARLGEALDRPGHRRGGGRLDRRLRLHPQDGAGPDLRLPAAVRHPDHRRASRSPTRPARSTSATSSWRRSCCSSPSSRATRSAGRSTSRTTRATCRRTSPCARRSTGPTAAPASARPGSCASASALAAWAGTSFTAPASPSCRPPATRSSHGFGSIILVFSALGLISVTALNMYGGSLTLLSAFDSFKRVQPTAPGSGRHRHADGGAVAGRRARQHRVVPGQLRELPAAGALLLHPVDRGEPGRLLHRPARPLRDRGDLQAARHLRPVGLARDRLLPGRLRGDGPVLQHRPFFTGWVADAADGADFSLFIGLPVSGVLYWVLCRNIDVAAEQRLAEQEADELEAGGNRHERPDR